MQLMVGEPDTAERGNRSGRFLEDFSQGIGAVPGIELTSQISPPQTGGSDEAGT
mgnify:CR=1 FL=1